MPPPIEKVKKKHQARLLNMPGVVSVGIGMNSAGRSAIIVGLDTARPDTASQLPSVLDGYPVEVRIIGAVRAQ
jgi:hypothetical protein